MLLPASLQIRIPLSEKYNVLLFTHIFFEFFINSNEKEKRIRKRKEEREREKER